MNWQTADFAAGERLAAWVDTHIDRDGIRERGSYATFARALSKWRQGDVVRYTTIDKWLTYFGHHLCELPDEVWCPPPDPRRQNMGWWEREPVRFCETCSGPIGFDRPSGTRRRTLKEYRAARWCCNDCRLRRVAPKACEGCGAMVPFEGPSGRRRGPWEYAKTRFCSPECQWAEHTPRARSFKKRAFREAA